jgi:hypothetical protein
MNKPSQISSSQTAPVLKKRKKSSGRNAPFPNYQTNVAAVNHEEIATSDVKTPKMRSSS